MADHRPTTHAIAENVCASLRLARCSSNMLSFIQLLEMKQALKYTLAIVDDQLEAKSIGPFLRNVPDV